MADFRPRLTQPQRYFSGVDVLQGNAAIDSRKILRSPSRILSPLVLDVANPNEALVAASGICRDDVWGYLRQEVLAQPDVRFGPRNLPNTMAFVGDEVQVSFGEMYIYLGADMYTGAIPVGGLLGWDGTQFFPTADPECALMMADTPGVGGVNPITAKVYPV